MLIFYDIISLMSMGGPYSFPRGALLLRYTVTYGPMCLHLVNTMHECWKQGGWVNYYTIGASVI